MCFFPSNFRGKCSIWDKLLWKPQFSFGLSKWLLGGVLKKTKRLLLSNDFAQEPMVAFQKPPKLAMISPQRIRVNITTTKTTTTTTTHPPIHPSTHPPIHPSTHPPIHSYLTIIMNHLWYKEVGCGQGRILQERSEKTLGFVGVLCCWIPSVGWSVAQMVLHVGKYLYQPFSVLANLGHFSPAGKCWLLNHPFLLEHLGWWIWWVSHFFFSNRAWGYQRKWMEWEDVYTPKN